MSLLGNGPKDQLSQYQQMVNQLQNAQAQSGMNQLGGLSAQYYQGMQNAGLFPGQVMITTAGSNPPAVIKLQPEEMVVEAITGWRRWSVTMFGEELLSNNGTKWVPFEKLTAKCSGGVADPAYAGCRGIHCHCGIYAYKTRLDAKDRDNKPSEITHVWGEVSLWGRVIEHRIGYRAQFAYPRAFVNTGGIAQSMATVYGVKVID
jgi:hypothetical protein